MSKNTSISLGKHFEDFIRKIINSGRFSSTSEVIREGLRLLEERESKILAINKALESGEESGFVENFSPDLLLKELKDQYKS